MSSNGTSNAKKPPPSGSSSNKKRRVGVDAFLTKRGKSLGIGEEIRFTLVKGPTHPIGPDPVHPTAPPETFPLMIKFPESVVKPDFEVDDKWKTSRLYQQDIPKATDDSDDEAAAAEAAAGGGTKRKWKRRKQLPKRQWILQEQVEFLQTMVERRQAAKSQAAKERLAERAKQISSRYEGIPEHNTSQFILLEAPSSSSGGTGAGATAMDVEGGGGGKGHLPTDGSTLQVTMLPSANATVVMSQPNARKTMSMAEAEEAISDQRGKMTRFMMHEKRRLLNGEQPQVSQSKTRLFGKLKQKAAAVAAANGDDEDDDDIMGDVAFRNRKGSGKRARKELLDTLGDSGLKVDADGVLGGANDSEFGGRGVKFGRFQNSNGKGQDKGSGGGGDDGEDGGGGAAGGGGQAGGGNTQSNDGMAMADDFYQRDVGAEYEELDYDANEQFDDDDVDLGESEVVVDGGGYAEEDEDDDLDDDLEPGEGPTGAEGLASLAGFRLMLAKARGEITTTAADQPDAAAQQPSNNGQDGNKHKTDQDDEPVDHLAQIIHAAEKSAQAAKQKAAGGGGGAPAASSSTKAPAAAATAAATATAELTGLEVDENGQRLVNLVSVRKEIWLQNGAIPMKRLMKIFAIKGKSLPERKAKFMEVVKELCTMETDPINGRMFVLKQHYSQMR